MTDPWYSAANQIRDRRAQEEEQAAAARRQQALEEAARRQAENAAYQEMQAAIAEAVPQLTTFLNERGAAAQQLLAAYEQAYISFGGYSEGGCYSNVYLSKDGLCHEVGVQSGYSSRPSRVEFASPQEAVEAFAREGEGQRNPERVRNIVSWLTDRIDGYIPK